MLNRNHYLALAGVGLLTLSLLNLPASLQTQVKSAIGASFLPLFGIRAAANDVLDRAGYQVLPRSTLIDNVLRLERENAELKKLLAEAHLDIYALKSAVGVKR